MNIKGLRKILSISQMTLSRETDIPQTRLSMWESGKSNPKTNDYIKLTNYFLDKISKIKLDQLSESDRSSIDEFLSNNQPKNIAKKAFYAGLAGEEFSTDFAEDSNTYELHDDVTILDGSYMSMTVPLVPFEAHARFLCDVDPTYEEWGKATFTIDKLEKGNYLAFKHKGESMINLDAPSLYDTPDGAVSLCKEITKDNWKCGFNWKNAPYGWIILTKKNILHKDIIDCDETTGEITCHSRNTSPEYSDFKLNLDEIYQIFKVIKRTF